MTKEKMIRWMRTALSVAKQSRCQRAQYGALILNKNGQLVASGYNGKPAGSVNDEECYRQNLPPNAHALPCCIHAEANCLMFSNRDEREEGTFFITGLPCEACMLLIMQSGVSHLVVIEDDERGYPGLELIDRYQGKGNPYSLEVTKLQRSEVRE